MRIKRFLVRYHPPGIIIEFEKSGKIKNREINLFDLNLNDDPKLEAINIIKNNHQIIKMENKKIEIITGTLV